jgi:hypothetical protein
LLISLAASVSAAASSRAAVASRASAGRVDIPCEARDFRLITRRVLHLLIAIPERHRFVCGMMAWIDGVQVPLVYDRDARAAGESKYPFTKMLRFVVDAITSFHRDGRSREDRRCDTRPDSPPAGLP